MSSRTASVLTAVVVALVYSTWEYHDRESHFKEVARLRAENERLRHGGAPDESKSRSMRDESTRPPSPTASGDPPGVEAVPASPATLNHTQAPAGTIARYRDEGRNTPVSALQTLAWACDSSDTTTMESLIAFDDTARVKAAAYYASLPPDLRSQWPTLEALAASVIIANGIRYPYPDAAAIEHAGKESVRPGRMVLLLPGTRYDRVEFQQFPDGWKRVITEAMVDDYLTELSHPR